MKIAWLALGLATALAGSLPASPALAREVSQADLQTAFIICRDWMGGALSFENESELGRWGYRPYSPDEGKVLQKPGRQKREGISRTDGAIQIVASEIGCMINAFHPQIAEVRTAFETWLVDPELGFVMDDERTAKRTDGSVWYKRNVGTKYILSLMVKADKPSETLPPQVVVLMTVNERD